MRNTLTTNQAAKLSLVAFASEEWSHLGGKEALLSLVAFASEAIENRDLNTALTVLRAAYARGKSGVWTNCQLRVLREALEAIEDHYLIDGTYDEAVDYGDCLPDAKKLIKDI